MMLESSFPADSDRMMSALGPTEFDGTLLALLTTLRRSLHACPERSGQELRTAETVARFLSAYDPTSLLLGVGGHGVLATFNGSRPGPTLVVRCDLDAVVSECTEPHLGADRNSVRHLCGHDGHMAIVAGLAPLLRVARPACGRVVLLFQPAEETGEGAARVLDDKRFRALAPDLALGFHNLPGFPLGTVALRSGVFASASVGMYTQFIGRASHAAQPEQARSPQQALARLLVSLPQLAQVLSGESGPMDLERRLLTITHARLGRESYGVTPGHAELLAVLRSTSHASLEQLKGAVEALVCHEARESQVAVELAWREEYPETRNDPVLVETVAEVAMQAGTPTMRLEEPFPWSDDFGRLAAQYPSVYFGLGIGENAGGLHQPDYAFPDSVISVGTQLLERTCRRLLESV